jgi:hypothetical protein
VSKALEELGGRVRAARLDQRWDVKGAAGAAGVARDTWKRVEEGLSVRDTSRAKVLAFLGLDDRGFPLPVGGAAEDADYVAAPGERVEPGTHDDQVLTELRAMREDINALSRRVARIESNPEPVGGADGPV